MPEEVSNQLPQVNNNEWKDLQFRFDGRWVPDVDGSLIGPNNYQTLRNLRYKDSGLEGVNGYSNINTTTLDGHGTLGDFPEIRNGFQLRSDQTQRTYVLVHSQNTSDLGRVFVNRTDIGSTGDFDTTSNFWQDDGDRVGGGASTQYPYFEDIESGLEGRFSSSPQGTLAYANSKETLLFGGDESQVAACFSLNASSTNPIDRTDDVNSDSENEYLEVDSGVRENFILMTTRPIQGVKMYIKTANTATDVTKTVKTWNGTAFTALTVTDNTEVGGAPLAQTGTMTWAHTKSTAKKYHFEELYLYAYLFEYTEAAGTDGYAEIYKITVDTAFQDIVDIWDGVYRQPVQCQLDKTNTGTYSEYSAQVNVESDEDNPVGMDLNAMTSAGNCVLMFSEQQAAIRFQMLGKFVEQDTNSPTIVVKYWDGDAYQTLGVTTDTDGTSCFSQSGLVYWNVPDDEEPRTLFNTFGYAYEITVTQTLDGVTDGTDKRVYVDLITGVPAEKDLPSYAFTTTYGTRLMLCAPRESNEGNRMDFTAANAPDVHNGADSSSVGDQSLYFGGVGDLKASAPLYNRFGSNLLSVLLVLKDAETYLLVGDTPDEFVIYEVSKTIGCPAPLTLATGEVNTSSKPTEGVTRNIAVWMSAAGPVMFDGASISSIRGMENFFDPNSDEYIEWDSISRARGWIDNVYKEYNLLIPSSTGQTENNKWLVYDLLRRKWFEKSPGSARTPQAAWEVIDTAGQRHNYAGIDSGYMIMLENGTSWAGTGITQKVKTGDFFPSSNIWDETLIRKFKLLTHKFEDVSASNTLNIYYYKNTEELIGSGVTWVGTDSGLTGVAVTFTDTAYVEWAATSVVSLNVNQDIGSRRVINITVDENRLAWAHSYEFEITTSAVPRGFRPIAWGVRYRIERKNDQATQ